MLYLIAVTAWLFAVGLATSIKGQFVGITEETKPDIPFKFVNSDNVSSRNKVTLVDMETFSSTEGIIDHKLRFEFNGVTAGTYELLVYSHDYVLTCDRFKVLVDQDSVSVAEDYLDDIEPSTPVDITNGTLWISVSSAKQYYETRSGSLKAMVMNSPLGPVFQSKLYTGLFVFTVVMMVGPYIIKYTNPELAKHLDELQKQGLQEPEKKPQPKKVHK